MNGTGFAGVSSSSQLGRNDPGLAGYARHAGGGRRENLVSKRERYHVDEGVTVKPKTSEV